MPVADLFGLGGHYDLMKMDIEGSEWSVLGDPRMTGLDVDLIVLEWHEQGCPAPDPRGHVVRLLREAGYGELHEASDLGTCGVFWARRSNKPQFASG